MPSSLEKVGCFPPSLAFTGPLNTMSAEEGATLVVVLAVVKLLRYQTFQVSFISSISSLSPK